MIQHPPLHFVWSDGQVDTTLSEFHRSLLERSEEAGWRLTEGHLQHALADQGYGGVIQDCNLPEHLDLLGRRLGVLVALGEGLYGADTGFVEILARPKLFKKGKDEFTATGRKALTAAVGSEPLAAAAGVAPDGSSAGGGAKTARSGGKRGRTSGS